MVIIPCLFNPGGYEIIKSLIMKSDQASAGNSRHQDGFYFVLYNCHQGIPGFWWCSK